MQRILLALLAALLIMGAAVSPTFAQDPAREPATERSDDSTPGYSLMRAMQADPQTSRTMVFVMVEEEMSYEKIAAAAEDGATETTVCGEKMCVCKADNHGGCEWFKWLCNKFGGQHTEAATSEGCFF